MTDLKKIIQLIEKTGDKAIIVEEGEPAYVIMSTDAYEKTLNRTSHYNFSAEKEAKKNEKDEPQHMPLSEEELLAKVNTDIAAYREKENDHYYVEPVKQ